MTSRFDANDSQERAAGLEAARDALAAQRCIVMPTDTVYGIAADAFSAQAVSTLLASKGRGRNMPPPVLMPSMQTMDGLAVDVTDEARALAAEFWPGALTLILHAQPSLTWDLGETRGTVALRVPDDEVARELLSVTGPLAVSSANRTGQPAALTAAEAFEQLGESVDVYLEAGVRPAIGQAGIGSTIIDCTMNPPRVVREGALGLEALRTVVPGILGLGEQAPLAESAAEPSQDAPRAGTPEAGTFEAPVSEATATEPPATKAPVTAEAKPRESDASRLPEPTSTESAPES